MLSEKPWRRAYALDLKGSAVARSNREGFSEREEREGVTTEGCG
jgi:hypothetical protein